MRRISWLIAISVALPLSALAEPGMANAAAAPPNLYAAVDATGHLTSGNGVAAVAQLGVGTYEVSFNSAVSSCAYVATPSAVASGALQAYTASGSTATAVKVEIRDQGGAPTDGGFHLVVDCGNFGMLYAVVGYTGNLVRGSQGTSVSTFGGGTYNIWFPPRITPCSYIATVGDPGTGQAPATTGVYTASGKNGHMVYVETKNAGGGLQSGIPFHLAVICQVTSRTLTAVVRPDGTLNRGSPRVTSSSTATGQYTIDSPYDVSGCAAVATRGSVDKSVPFNPTTVEVSAGATSTSVGVVLRELAFFGGDDFNEAFHVAIVC